MVLEETEPGLSNPKVSKGANDATPEVCFVCDQKVVGEKIFLSKSSAPYSRIGLPEKISNLIGEEFVVIVTEQDVLCKRCCSLLHHMDRLDNELLLVKKALINYIKQKYNLPVEEPTMYPSAKSGDENEADETNENEDETSGAVGDEPSIPSLKSTPAPTPLTTQVSTSLSSPGRKRPAPSIPKPKDFVPKTRPQIDPSMPKMKIYRCGFCSFQSKELNNVRVHMKIHVKPNIKREEEIPITSTPKPPSAQSASNAVKRRLFRCQVCSASFEERAKCVEHISLEHTASGKKRVPPAEEKKPTTVQQEVKDQPEPMDTSTASEEQLDMKPTSSTEQFGTTAGPEADYFASEGDITDSSQSSLLLTPEGAAELQQFAAGNVSKETHAAEVEETGNLVAADTLTSSGLLLDDKLQVKVDGMETEKGLDEPEDTSESADADKDDKNKNVHSIDIEAMIAALHSEDGPAPSL